MTNSLAISLGARPKELLKVVKCHRHVHDRMGKALGIDLCLELAELVELHGLEGMAAVLV